VPKTTRTLSFKGGYRFRGFLGDPEDAVIDVETGDTAIVPLGSASAAVETGTTVSVGQTIGESPAGPYRVIVSPASGTVRTVSEAAVEIEPGADQSWTPVAGAAREWENLPEDLLEDILLASGSCCLADEGLPTRHGTSVLDRQSVRRVVVHDSASEVYTASVQALLDGRDAADLVEGLAILRRLYSAAEIHVVLGADSAPLARDIGNSDRELKIHHGSPRYPQNHPAVLVGTLFGEQMSSQTLPSASGTVILDVQAVLQIRDAVTAGKPNIERIIALAGPGFSTTGHAKVRIGTPVSRLAESRLTEDRSPRLIANSVMTGRQLDVADPVDHRFTALIALPKTGPEFVPFATPGFRKDSISFTFLASVLPTKKTLDDNLHGEERACVGCGYCEEVCPVGILPFYLHRFVQRGMIDERLVRYGAFRCIDCNLCTYVCVSKIPLAKLLADGKKALLDEGYAPPQVAESKEGFR
jgi:Na(+)-translocating NADH:ubiquinone oxidoreductase A subunit